MSNTLFKSLLFITVLTISPVFAQSSVENVSLSNLFATEKTKFLPVEQAFNVQIDQQNNTLNVVIKVTPEHYVYKDKLMLVLPPNLTATPWRFDIPHTMIDDPVFGRVPIFEQDVVASVQLSATADVNAVPISIKWQGCAKAGLCYPPETSHFNVTLKAAKEVKTNTATVNDVHNTTDSKRATSQAKSSDKIASTTTTVPIVNDASQPASSVVSTEYTSQQEQNLDKPYEEAAQNTTDLVQTPVNTLVLNHNSHKVLDTQTDPFGINDNRALAILLLFLAGLLLSFTPCVYPMIPIVANIVARARTHSPFKGFVLSASYGVGVASAYGLLGAVIAWFGQAVGVVGLLQNPYMLGAFAIIFALLALYMFDMLKIALPASIRHVLQQASGAADDKLGGVGGSFLVGMLSALVVSPCVSAPMAGALTAVSVSGSALFGFAALFSLGLGLSVPLMFIGLVQGRFMPKAGEWMNRVKEFCGLLLLAVSLSLLERLILSPMMLVIWAAWFAMCAVWLFRMAILPARAFALISAIWTACLMLGAAMGNEDAWRPLMMIANQSLGVQGNSVATPSVIKVTNLAELDKVLITHPKVLVDITAEWCIECRIMERTLFRQPPQALAGYQVVKLDITKTTDDSRAVLARYQLFGPPALLFYQEGQLKQVLLGEVKRSDFEAALLAQAQ